MLASVKNDAIKTEIAGKVLSYTDVLSSNIEKCRDKDVLIYGGGATAAWAMEIAAAHSHPLAWVAKSGFCEAVNAGPRVGAILDDTRALQLHGTITSITHAIDSSSNENKLLISITMENPEKTVKTFLVDNLINCIGQEPYEEKGLPEIISPALKKELTPYLDKNNVVGMEQTTRLGWITGQEDFLIIGAAQGTYYDNERTVNRHGSVSDFMPRSGRVRTTIGGVVSTVCALTNYTPMTQDPKTGEVNLTSLNLHVMNATQLGV